MKIVFVGLQDIFGEINNGGTQCSKKNYFLITSMAGQNNTQCVIVGENRSINSYVKYVRKVNNRIEALLSSLFLCKFYMPKEEKKIVSYIEQYNPDVLYLDSSLVGKILKKLSLNMRTIVFFHNIEADYAWNKVKNEGLIYLPSYWASKYNEKCAMNADMVVALNARDSNRMQELYGRKADFLLPITFNDSFDKKKTITSYHKEILFLGSLFPPNQFSIEWFINEVMIKLPEITLNIVGKDFEKCKEEYEKTRNVNVIGTVEKTDIFYYRHSAVVLPIKYGAGIKVKTAEAMMYGRRIFASDEALEGYEVEGIQGITRCNSAEDYITAISDYFQYEEKLPYQPDVRALFLEKYETECVKKQFDKAIKQLVCLRKE